MRTEAAGKAGEEYARIRTEYRTDAWLYRTVTTKELTGERKPEIGPASEISPGDSVAEAQAALYYVSVDTKGEIGWAYFVRPDAHAIEVLTEQPRRAGDFPAQEDRMLGWRWNLAGMFGKRQTARRKKRGRISVRGCF